MDRRIMIIDDEASIRISLEEGLSDLGYSICAVKSLKEADVEIQKYHPHVILLDIRLKDGNGIDYIDIIRAMDDEIKIIVMTAYGDIQNAVLAMKKGAFEFVTKPFDLDEMEIHIERVFETINTNRKLKIFEEQHEKDKIRDTILTQDDQMKALLIRAKKIALEDSVTVLVTGETGTGKELIGDYIHRHSSRSHMPMVKINCASIPKDLFESELFGHEKNAFTGAGQLKKGLIEIADGGTVFLDEIGEIPLNQQAKLLRFLEERKIKRVGGVQNIDVNVRVIAATNRNLLEMVHQGTFRADLYYRINVIPIEVMPLRERPSDIIYPAEHFKNFYNHKFNKRISGFTEQTIKKMNLYKWPGNIRELKNLVERACIIHDEGELTFADFPNCDETKIFSSQRYTFDFLKDIEMGRAIDLPEHLIHLENECIDHALDICNGNQSKAAELLNISRFSLKRRLEKQS